MVRTVDPAQPAQRPAALLLTGAAGTLGRALAPALEAWLGGAARFVLSDLPGPLAALPPDLAPGAERKACELADGDGVHALLDGIDAVVHLGGVAIEGPFEPILEANVRGMHHLYEAARRRGTRRIVFASSNHVVGLWPRGTQLAEHDPPRPDGNYGLSKLFGEGLGSLYWHRYGIETVVLRIGTATPTPPDRRGLSTWISPGDLVRLVTAALTARDVGFTIAWGISRNTRRWWNAEAGWARIGYAPQDDAEAHAAQVASRELPAGPQTELQGGSFLGIGPFDEP
jgi:uronate dehydrogenase